MEERNFVTADRRFLTGHEGPVFTVFAAIAPEGWEKGKPLVPLRPRQFAAQNQDLVIGPEWFQVNEPTGLISHTMRAELLRQHLLTSTGYAVDSSTRVLLLTGHRLSARDWWAIFLALCEEEQLANWQERAAILHHPDQFAPIRVQHDLLMRLHDRILRIEPQFGLGAAQIHAVMAGFLRMTRQGFEVHHGLFGNRPGLG